MRETGRLAIRMRETGTSTIADAAPPRRFITPPWVGSVTTHHPSSIVALDHAREMTASAPKLHQPLHTPSPEHSP